MGKRSSWFLYLAIACFIGITAIFIFAGYLGVYDTVYVSAGEYQQEIGSEFWWGQERIPFPYSIGATWGEPVRFRYEIDNRRFSTYTAIADATLWKGDRKVIDLFHQDISIGGFDKAVVDWTLSPEDLSKAGLEIGQYTVRIRRGEVELGKGIILGFNQSPPGYPVKPIPIPAPG